ncbi:TPA: DUF3644 domain-containing protein [Candidatus Avigastranaerophilus faecigallinarum]|nr:DUF3644 domain-containing protein [Candidatus Avigastranaerophilus faecigallinarum]
MRRRIIKSIANELILKSREAALSAVQIFNNPLIQFKSETFIVLMVIAWTYLLHAYYRKNKINYKYIDREKSTSRRIRYKLTPQGAVKYWELSQCLSTKLCPLDKETKKNLEFLLCIRHEIEHRMTTRIDNEVSGKFQACCLNYNRYVKNLFGDKYGIDKYLSFSLQFSTISMEQKDILLTDSNLPKNITGAINTFEQNISDRIFNHPNYSYRVIFTQKLVNHKNQADEVIEFVKSDSQLGADINKVYIQEKDKKKYKPKMIVNKMIEEGFTNFTITKHTLLWQNEKAKGNPKYGTYPYEGKSTWDWYETWVDFVRNWCKQNEENINDEE